MKKYSEYDLKKGKDNYQWALEMAGAEVLAFNSFGSYQGDWFAKVKYEGKVGWIHGHYGSCSGCDDWYAETEYQDRTEKEWKEFCITFAREYLDEIVTYETVFGEANQNTDWDLDAKEMVEWLKQNH